MACSKEDSPPANVPGVGWRRTGGEREWHRGGHGVDRGGTADGCVHGRAGVGGHVRDARGGHGVTGHVLDVVGGGGMARGVVRAGGRVRGGADRRECT